MKYCTFCGHEIPDDALFCQSCGNRVVQNQQTQPQQGYTAVPSCGNQNDVSSSDKTMETVIKVFMILGCVSLGWAIIPLAWCIPMTVSAFKKFETGEKMSTGFKVCTLLFVNVVAGICMLCSDC